MVTPASFIVDFPEFATAAPSAIAFYLNYAVQMIPASWGITAPLGQPNTIYDIGCELFIAHNLFIELTNQQIAQGGGIPGQSKGPVTGESGGPVSISYDTTSGIIADAGHWNLSNYGTRFILMARQFGSAPLQIGAVGYVGGYGGGYYGGYGDYGGGYGSGYGGCDAAAGLPMIAFEY